MKVFQLLCVFLFVSLLSHKSLGEEIEFSADDYKMDMSTRLTTAVGNVKISYKGQTLLTSKIIIDGKNSVVISDSEFEFHHNNIHIKGKKINWNLNTGLGIIEEGEITIEKKIYMEGRKIERYGDNLYRIEFGKISTCMTCPQPWSVSGSLLDVEVESYATIHHALLQILDQPVFYVPYLVFPVKSKRQSGFLIPKFFYSSYLGSGVNIPYFYPMSESFDTTLEFQPMTKAGIYFGNELRKVWGTRSFINFNQGFVSNNEDSYGAKFRYGTRLENYYQINSHVIQRADFEIATDAYFTQHLTRLFENPESPFTSQDLSLSYQKSNLFAGMHLTSFMENIPKANSYLLKPSSMTARLPEVGVYLGDQALISKIRSQNYFHYEYFYRPEGAILPDSQWISSGGRFGVNHEIYYQNRIAIFNSKTQLNLRADAYHFPSEVEETYAGRFIPRISEDVNFKMWKVFESDSKEFSALKHSIEPNIGWSYSGKEWLSDHKFFEQGKDYVGSYRSPQFDIFDPNQFEQGDFVLGNIGDELRLRPHHLITFTLNSKLTARSGEKSEANYWDFVSMSLSQDYDLDNNTRGVLTARAKVSYGILTLNSIFTYNPQSDITAYENSQRIAFSNTQFELWEYKSKNIDRYAFEALFKRLGPFNFSSEVQYDAVSERISKQAYGLYMGGSNDCYTFKFKMTKTDAKFNPSIEFSIKLDEDKKLF